MNQVQSGSDFGPIGRLAFSTHEVRNQARPADRFNAFEDDAALHGLVTKLAPWARPKLSSLGAHAGDETIQDAARLANEHEPKLRSHDRYGHRDDWVEFHPAWHELMSLAFRHEVHSLAWTTGESSGHFARACLSYLWNQIENGVGCPTGMAYAAGAGFKDKAPFALWRERVLAADYDQRRIPIAGKRAAVVGYAMTEKQGGSDLRQTQTTARFLESRAEGELYAITGHKWFCSVPVADGFFTLAQTTSGVSCLFVPRLLPDGQRNHFLIQRLKDKCGNRSNASAEIEFAETLSILVGEEGRGLREILSHAHLTRLDFAAGSAGLMRQALTLAINHAQSRSAFGRAMADLPMQQNVLADLAIESEAAMLGALRVARTFDAMERESDEHERLLSRIATPVMKFWNCQRAPYFVYECLQAQGGNGFILENPMARLYREAPLNSIWEGTSNMMGMDVLRAMDKDVRCRDAFVDELRRHRGADSAFDSYADDLADRLRVKHPSDGHARALVTRMAFAIQAGELLEHAPSDVAGLFIRTRLSADWMPVLGTLPESDALPRIVKRAAVVKR